MTLTLPRPTGLRRDLMLGLTLPLLVIVVATATLGTYAAHRLTERVFDRWLLDAARSVTVLLSFDAHGDAQVAISAQTDAVLLFDDRDRIWYAVLQDGRLLTGRSACPTTASARRATARVRPSMRCSKITQCGWRVPRWRRAESPLSC